MKRGVVRCKARRSAECNYDAIVNCATEKTSTDFSHRNRCTIPSQFRVLVTGSKSENRDGWVSRCVVTNFGRRIYQANVGFATFIDAQAGCMSRKKKDGEDLECETHDGGWQLWLVKIGTVSNVRNTYAMERLAAIATALVLSHGDD